MTVNTRYRHLLHCLNLAALLLWSSAAPARVGDERQLMQDIASQRLPDTYQTLLVGDREVVMVEYPARTPITRGLAVLITEAGGVPQDDHQLARLARQLTHYGWHTLTMAAPPLGDPQILLTLPPATDAAPQAAPEQEAEAALHGRADLLHSPVQHLQAQQYALQQQMLQLEDRRAEVAGFYLIIAQGTTAASLARLYTEQAIPQPDGLVSLGAFLPERNLNKALPEMFAQLQPALLDVYSAWDNRWTLSTTDARRVAATRGLKLHYRQQELVGQPRDEQQTLRLAKMIYGWLTYMGW
ncbi:alpha/beta hydrolase family protein [Aestuariibacter halophilus]|uniref:Alpha/beta hydrolase family protein n=1 Tax=Fluctibacter halophilus TaxID=226011 RepID=A0ABS8GDS5_9ALTE|nr:DUF3530 family protein [Aestuariibacter halophilus]MCC2617949.1 alpha/beta hydrolase family protein [Aestuariibacter halophilus]